MNGWPGSTLAQQTHCTNITDQARGNYHCLNWIVSVVCCITTQLSSFWCLKLFVVCVLSKQLRFIFVVQVKLYTSAVIGLYNFLIWLVLQACTARPACTGQAFSRLTFLSDNKRPELKGSTWTGCLVSSHIVPCQSQCWVVLRLAALRPLVCQEQVDSTIGFLKIC